MTRKERKSLKNKIKIKEELNQFYKSYKYQLDDAVKFGDLEVRGRLVAIENLFSPYVSENNRLAKQRAFNMPMPYLRYMEFKSMKDWMVYHKNKEFKKALKEMETIYEKQWFRNMEIFRIMIKRLEEYKVQLKRNRCLKRLSKKYSYIGYQSTVFRRKRIEEVNTFMLEFKRIGGLVKKEIFINDIERYMRMYTDFFVQCQFRLDKFVESINLSLADEPVINKRNKRILIKKVKERDMSLDLPSWNQISRFDI